MFTHNNSTVSNQNQDNLLPPFSPPPPPPPQVVSIHEPSIDIDKHTNVIPYAATAPPPLEVLPGITSSPIPVIQSEYNPTTNSFMTLSNSQENIDQIVEKIKYYLERKLLRYPIHNFSSITPHINDITTIEFRKQKDVSDPTKQLYFVKSLVSLQDTSQPCYIHMRISHRHNSYRLDRMVPYMKEGDALGYLEEDKH